MNTATHVHCHLAERVFPNNVKVMHEAKYSNVKSERGRVARPLHVHNKRD